MRQKSREAAPFGVLWLALVAFAVALNLLHLKAQLPASATRLALPPGSYLATDPVVTGEKVLFTTMTDAGYRTAVFDGNSFTTLWLGADSFHPAITPGSGSGWVELASSRSRIVRFALDANGANAGQAVVEVEDAEKPAVSMDRRWLAFIRETKGTGKLWVKELQPRADGAGSFERQLSGDDMDVLEASFDPADRIVFAARRGPSPALFWAEPQGNSVALESAPAPRRYPAASPDGRWLAFSQRERSYWQLWVQDRITGAERRLTSADCNSTAPAWYADSKHLVYAADCGRGYGLTALYRIQAAP